MRFFLFQEHKRVLLWFLLLTIRFLIFNSLVRSLGITTVNRDDCNRVSTIQNQDLQEVFRQVTSYEVQFRRIETSKPKTFLRWTGGAYNTRIE